MRRIAWTEEAIGNLEEIVEYIELNNPAAAAQIGARLRALAESLATFSERGRPLGGEVRQLSVVRPYLMRYRVDGDVVTILRVRHGARLQD